MISILTKVLMIKKFKIFLYDSSFLMVIIGDLVYQNSKKNLGLVMDQTLQILLKVDNKLLDPNIRVQ